MALLLRIAPESPSTLADLSLLLGTCSFLFPHMACDVRGIGIYQRCVCVCTLVYVCMYVCTSVCVCVQSLCIPEYTCVYVYVCTCIHLSVHVYVCVHVCIHVCMCVHLCAHMGASRVSLYWDILHPASLHTHCMSVWVCTPHACVHVYTCLWPCACVSVSTCVYMYLCLYACGHLPVHVCVWVRCSHPGEDPPRGHSCKAAQSPPPQGCLCPARLPAVPGRGLDSPHGIQDLSRA